VPLKDIKPNPRNYNKHPEAQIDLLAKNIKSVGWRHPITVSKLSGLIVAGHARLEAAKRLGLSSAPVNFQDFKDVSEEMAVLIADNRLAELAEPSMPELKDLLLELDTGALDMSLTGFDEKAMEDLMTQFHVPDENKPIDEAGMADTKNECPKCGFKW
jgi:ParB-like chromosome segregation protein Spo0J